MNFDRTSINVFVCSHEDDPFFQEGRSRTLWAANMANAFAELGFPTYLCASLKNTPVRAGSNEQRLKWVKDEVDNFFLSGNKFEILDSSELAHATKNKNHKHLLLTRSPLLASSLSCENCSVILEDHDEEIQKSFRSEYANLTVANAVRIVAITHEVANAIVSSFNLTHDVKVLPSGVNPDTKMPNPKPGAKPCFVYMGGLHPERGLDFLYKAAVYNTDSIFYVFGGRKNDVEQLRSRHQRSKNLVFAGFHKAKDIYAFLESVNPVFVYTRHHDHLENTSPLKLLEYFKSGSCIVRPNYEHLSSGACLDAVLNYDPYSFDSFKRTLLAASSMQAELSISDISTLIMKRHKFIEQYSWKNRARQILALVGE